MIDSNTLQLHDVLSQYFFLYAVTLQHHISFLRTLSPISIWEQSDFSASSCCRSIIKDTGDKAGAESPKGKPCNLQRINNLNSRFKRLIAPFKGVGSRYLNNYLAWNGFDMNHIGVNKLDIKDKLAAAMNSIGDFSTYKEVFGKPALPFLVSE